jgi:hypothetical protein
MSVTNEHAYNCQLWIFGRHFALDRPRGRRLARPESSKTSRVCQGFQQLFHATQFAGGGARATLTFSYRATTFSISPRNSLYGTAPGWYQATLPSRSSSTSVGVVDAPYTSKLYVLMGTGMSSNPE